MTTFTASISGSAIVNGSHSWTISDADLQSLLDWATVTFAAPGGPPLANGPALIAWMQAMLDFSRSNVAGFKQDQARKAISIPAIVFTG